jgi:hypothetical protein
MVKSFPFFGIEQVINPAMPELMDFLAESVADAIAEKVENPAGFFHGCSVLLPVFQLLPPDQTAHPHDGAGQRPTGFPHPGDSSGQRAPRLENLLASHLQLILQSRKNGLGSAEIGHVIIKGLFKYLIQEFFAIFHVLLLLDRINFNAFSSHDINLPGSPIEWVKRLKKSYRNTREMKRDYF